MDGWMVFFTRLQHTHALVVEACGLSFRVDDG